MKKHFWLVSSEVYKLGDLGSPKYIGETNVSSQKKWLNKEALEGVKKGFLDYAISQGCPTDCYVNIKSVSYLGEMTQEEWEE